MRRIVQLCIGVVGFANIVAILIAMTASPARSEDAPSPPAQPCCILLLIDRSRL